MVAGGAKQLAPHFHLPPSPRKIESKAFKQDRLVLARTSDAGLTSNSVFR